MHGARWDPLTLSVGQAAQAIVSMVYHIGGRLTQIELPVLPALTRQPWRSLLLPGACPNDVAIILRWPLRAARDPQSFMLHRQWHPFAGVANNCRQRQLLAAAWSLQGTCKPTGTSSSRMLDCV